MDLSKDRLCGRGVGGGRGHGSGGGGGGGVNRIHLSQEKAKWQSLTTFSNNPRMHEMVGNSSG